MLNLPLEIHSRLENGTKSPSQASFDGAAYGVRYSRSLCRPAGGGPQPDSADELLRHILHGGLQFFLIFIGELGGVRPPDLGAQVSEALRGPDRAHDGGEVALQLELALHHALGAVELLLADLGPALQRAGDDEVPGLADIGRDDPYGAAVTVPQVHEDVEVDVKAVIGCRLHVRDDRAFPVLGGLPVLRVPLDDLLVQGHPLRGEVDVWRRLLRPPGQHCLVLALPLVGAVLQRHSIPSFFEHWSGTVRPKEKPVGYYISKPQNRFCERPQAAKMGSGTNAK